MKSQPMKQSQIIKLLRTYSRIIEILRNAGVTKSANLVGGYGEYIVSRTLNLNQKSSTNKGFDATSGKGEKFEIRVRKINSWGKPSYFSAKSHKKKKFDYLVCVMFKDDWSFDDVLKIPRKDLPSIKDRKYNRVPYTSKIRDKYSILNEIKRRARATNE